MGVSLPAEFAHRKSAFGNFLITCFNEFGVFFSNLCKFNHIAHKLFVSKLNVIIRLTTDKNNGIILFWVLSRNVFRNFTIHVRTKDMKLWNTPTEHVKTIESSLALP